MQSATVDVFFSCSFAAGDEDVNELFLSISKALGLHPTNVSTGSSSTPPEVAKQKISASQAVIAVCTRRDEFKDGSYAMPQAVHDEISFAYGKDIPILMIVEEGVTLKGFKQNFGTYLPFSRLQMRNSEFLGKAIEALHDIKLSVLEPYNLGADRGITDSHAEYIHHLVELKCDGGEYIWHYNNTKKLIYSKSSKRAFPASMWATVPPNLPEDTPPIEFKAERISSSRNIDLDVSIERQTATNVEAMIRLSPSPEEGDFIEYSTSMSSRYINPVWSDEVGVGSAVHLESGAYKCADGIIPIHRTKRVVIEFRFAKQYGFSKSDVYTFVGSYTSSIDYEVESEKARMQTRMEDFGGNLIVRLEIESPLPGHMYGIAWNPRDRPAAVATDV